jgi:hypothetical protein
MGHLGPRKHLSLTIQLTMSVSTINLSEKLFADPEYGEVYRSLFNGGSWFAADQAYWGILQQTAANALSELVETKPSSYNLGKAEALLEQMKEASSQLVPPEISMSAFFYTEAVVKTWSAPLKKKSAVTVKNDNAFSALDSEDE